MSTKNDLLNKKISFYFNNNPNLDKSKILGSIENLINGNNINNEQISLLKNTGFFEILNNFSDDKIKDKNIPQINDNNELINIKTKITLLYDLIIKKLSTDNLVKINQIKKLFNSSEVSESDNKSLNYDEFYNAVTDEIFDKCQKKINNIKGKFEYSSEMIKILNDVINKIYDNDNNNYLSNDSSKIKNILKELSIDDNIVKTIDLNDQKSIDIIESVYSDYKSNESSSEVNSNDRETELLDRISKLEDNKNKMNDIINSILNLKSNNKNSNQEIISNFNENINLIKNDLIKIDSENIKNNKELEIVKKRISMLDTDLTKHKECVINSFQIIEERLTQLFKSMIIVNNNIKHCYSNTEKMCNELENKIKIK